MGRIIKQIEINGRPATALFDTGALHTYGRADFLEGSPRIPMPHLVRVALGGQTIDIKELCFVAGKIEGLDFVTDAVPVERLGEIDGSHLDTVIGARTMEQWELRLDPRNGASVWRDCAVAS